jgi:hypothetical protein
MRAFMSLVSVVAVVSLAVPLQAQSSTSSQSLVPPAASVFNPGDAVRVTVWRNPELSGQFDIAEDGTILHPLYRSIQAAGVPVPQVEAEIRSVLQRFEVNPEMVVEPLFRVYVGGEVRSPNMYTLSPATTVFHAIMEAGGPTPRARLDRARVLRDGAVIPVDLTLPAQELNHLRIRSGDQIVLDPRRNVWVDYVQPTISVAGSVASLAYLFIRFRYYTR